MQASGTSDTRFLVNVSIVVVPDGIETINKKRFCRLSLALAPQVPTPSIPGLLVDIRNWPSEVAKIVRSLRIAVGRIQGPTTPERAVEGVRYLRAPVSSDVPLGFDRQGTELWKRIFLDGTDDHDAGFLALLDALRGGAAGPLAGQLKSARAQFGTSQTADVARTIDALYGSAAATTLLQRLSNHVSGAELRLKDASVPGIPWWRMLREHWFVHKPLGDPVSSLMAASLRPSDGSDARNDFGAETTLAVRMEMNEAGRFLLSEDEPEGTSSVAFASRPAKVFAALQESGKYFVDRIGDAEFWQNGHAPDEKHFSVQAAAAFRTEIVRFAESRPNTYRLVSDEPSVQDRAKEAAGRKYASILSYPTLAKYLGLIVDTKVEANLLLNSSAEARDRGAVSIFPIRDTTGQLVPDPSPQRLIWTAYVLRKPDGVVEYFGPCDRTETLTNKENEKSALQDGILNLGMKTSSGVPRFELATLDVSNSALALEQCSVRISEADLQGKSSVENKLPDRQSRGIALLDRDREHQEQERAAREIQIRNLAKDGASGMKVLDAQDLTVGYRIDAAMATANGEWRGTRKKRWRTLVGRSVGYGRDIDPVFLGLNAVQSVRNRDDGHIRPMTRWAEIHPEDGGKPITQVCPHPELFTWTGESLAVPSLRAVLDPGSKGTVASDGRTLWPNPALDLAVDLEFDLPSRRSSNDEHRLPIPLRELHRYIFGARLCLLNGCSLDFDAAVTRYGASGRSLALGSKPNTPMLYARRSEIQAPDVLLPWDDRIVTAPKDRTPRGETIDELVVRSGGIKTPRARRFVVPPRTTFDLAEQHGMFDSDQVVIRQSGTPAGAFTGKARASLDPVLGTFPVARDGKWDFPKTQKGRPVEQPPRKEKSRGSVLVLDSAAVPPKVEFYPDPMARRMCARFVRDGQDAANFDRHSDPIEFWSDLNQPSDAAPVVLELRTCGSRQRRALRGWFESGSDNVLTKGSAASLCLNTLSVVLEPGELIELEIWSVPDPEKIVKGHHSVAQALELLKKAHRSRGSFDAQLLMVGQPAKRRFNTLLNALHSGDDQIQYKLIDEIVTQSAMAQLTTKHVVRLVHAVDRPKAPRFLPSAEHRSGHLQFHPVVLTVNQADPTKADNTWNLFVAKQESARRDCLLWPSEEGGSTTFFVGKVGVDRLTSGSLRCDARWLEYVPDTVRYDSKQRVWVHDPPLHYAQLFTIDTIGLTDDLRETPLDLLRTDELTGFRALTHSFVNGKARRLSLRLIATSRFTDYYPLETKREVEARKATGIGRYERGTKDFPTHRAKLASAVDNNDVWVPCTFRPTVPEIDRILPVFHWTNDSHDGGQELRWKRESSLRVFMKRSWHSSGEGEVLGVVCWPSNLLSGNPEEEAAAAEEISRKNICDVEETGRYSQFITRWGTDPIHLSGQLDDLISADRFSGFSRKVTKSSGNTELLLTLAGPGGSGASGLASRQVAGKAQVKKNGPLEPVLAPLPVCVLAYEPMLDQTDGLWYCDITVDHGAAYYPFLQLGLSRYQPNSVDGLELSHPVAAWAQLPPRRQGRVFFRNDHQLTMELSGIGFHRSETGPKHIKQRYLSDFPLLNVRLMRAAQAGGVAANSSGGINWHPVSDKQDKPIETVHLRPVQRGAEVFWSLDITLPRSRREIVYGLLLEEVEYLEADEKVPGGDPQSSPESRFTTELKERGPMFAHIVDLR